MKQIIAHLKDARIDILSSRNSLNRIGGREISVFELDQADDYLVRVLKRLESLEPDPKAPVNRNRLEKIQEWPEQKPKTENRKPKTGL